MSELDDEPSACTRSTTVLGAISYELEIARVHFVIMNYVPWELECMILFD